MVPNTSWAPVQIGVPVIVRRKPIEPACAEFGERELRTGGVVGGFTIVIWNEPVELLFAESKIVPVVVNVPVWVGVPDTSPPEETDSPGGNVAKFALNP